jgi:outer membrane lipoprotein-sorting protein
MKKILIAGILAILLINGTSLRAQLDADPNRILDKVLEQQKDILDYKVKVEIDVDVEFIKMPVKSAELYFKQPDKIKFKSDEFLMLPKKGLNQSVQKLLSEEYTAVLTGQELIERDYHYIIKIIPMGGSQDVVLSTVWVDSTTYLISRMESYTKSRGNSLISFEYYEDLKLPSKMTVEFEVKEFNIPLDFINRSIEIDKEKMKSDSLKTGYIYLNFYDYQVNQRLDDGFFEDE